MSMAIVFPGQGSQFVGMGKDFYDGFPEIRSFFHKADEVLGYGLTQIMFEGSEEELKLTQNTQPALVTMSAVVWELVKSKFKPTYFAGHSLGEYSAIYAANGLSFEDTVLAVHNRGKFMQNAVPVGVGGMRAIIGIDDETVIEVCNAVSKEDFIVEPANFNCVGQVVIAGEKDAVETAGEVLKSKGAKRVIPLPVSAPFHCSLMAPAGKEMEKYLEKLTINDLSTPIINNIDAKEVYLAPDVLDGLIRQVSGTVQWTNSVRYMISKGINKFVEVGAGSILTGLIKKIDKEVDVLSISSVEDLEKL